MPFKLKTQTLNSASTESRMPFKLKTQTLNSASTGSRIPFKLKTQTDICWTSSHIDHPEILSVGFMTLYSNLRSCSVILFLVNLLHVCKCTSTLNRHVIQKIVHCKSTHCKSTIILNFIQLYSLFLFRAIIQLF